MAHSAKWVGFEAAFPGPGCRARSAQQHQNKHAQGEGTTSAWRPRSRVWPSRYGRVRSSSACPIQGKHVVSCNREMNCSHVAAGRYEPWLGQTHTCL